MIKEALVQENDEEIRIPHQEGDTARQLEQEASITLHKVATYFSASLDDPDVFRQLLIILKDAAEQMDKKLGVEPLMVNEEKKGK